MDYKRRLHALPRWAPRVLAGGVPLILLSLLRCASDDAANARAHDDAGADAHIPYDDDTERLEHCSYEAAPTRAVSGSPAPTTLQAGFASGHLELPIGTPMGGYGARTTVLGGKGASIAVDGRVARFATRFIPSVGTHDVPRVDALALEAGGESLIVLRTDALLITETVVFAIERAIAKDGSMRGRVILAASHTHSGWSNWIPSLALVPGIDSPRKDLFDKVVAVHADVARAAIAQLAPARIGFAVDPTADPKNEISHDRRTENDDILGPDGNTAGQDKDHAVWALRVDRSDGSPLAALLAFPIHGTRGGEHNPLVSSDAPGAIQRSLSQRLGYPVLHLQGAAGDVSPGGPTGRTACPDSRRCLDAPNLEVVGAMAADMFEGLIAGIQTHDKLALEVVTRSFYVGRAGIVTRPDGRELYYPPPGDYEADRILFDESGIIASPLDEFNAPHGAALCGKLGGGSLMPLPGTVGLGAYASCNDVERLAPSIAALYDLPSVKTPVCDTTRATSSAVRFDTGSGSPLLLLSVPGEPTAPFAAYLRNRSPAGPDRTLLLGYAQDHVGYVLTAEDWLAGGYEPSINIWGPLEGEMVLDGILEGAELAWTPEREDPERGTSRFTEFPFPELPAVVPVVTSDHGTVPTQAPATLFLPDVTSPLAGAQPDALVPRATGVAHFVWLGGDPAVDFPHVIVERETSGGVFEPVRDSRGEAASSAGGAVVLTYTPDPVNAQAPAHHYYVATWQTVPPDTLSMNAPALPYSLPLGHYRLSVSGRARASTGTVGYVVSSQTFEVVAASLTTAKATRAAGNISITALLGNAPGMRALRVGSSDQNVPLLGPWNVTVAFATGPSKTMKVTPTPEGQGDLALNAGDAATAINLEVRDSAGNGGVIPVED